MFKIGDKVRVKAEVKNPKYLWGPVEHDSVGVVVRAPSRNGYMPVTFPEMDHWMAHAPEMELVEEIKKPEPKAVEQKVKLVNGPKKPFTAKDIHNRPVYAQLKASAVDARTLTKLVKAYLVNLNAMADAEEKFEVRTAKVISSFNWAETPEGNAFWLAVQVGRPVKFEDIKPKVAKKAAPKAPQQAPIIEPAEPVVKPLIGRGERPEGATHWNDFHGRWLKVDINGVVYWWRYDEEWCAYINQNIGKERVRNAIVLEPAAEMVVVKGRRGQPKPAVEQPAQDVKEPAPRIGWW